MFVPPAQHSCDEKKENKNFHFGVEIEREKKSGVNFLTLLYLFPLNKRKKNFCRRAKRKLVSQNKKQNCCYYFIIIRNDTNKTDFNINKLCTFIVSPYLLQKKKKIAKIIVYFGIYIKTCWRVATK